MPSLDQNISIYDYYIVNWKQADVDVDTARSRYSYFEESAGQGALKPVLAGYECTNPNYLLERASFPCFGLELVVGGAGKLTLGSRHFLLRHGSVFTYGPGIAQRIESDRRQPLRKYFIDLQGRISAASKGMRAGVCFFSSKADRMASLFEGLLRDHADGQDSPSIQQHSIQLILDLAEISLGEDRGTRSGAFQTYQKIRLHLETNYHKPCSISAFASELHVDSTYLTRLFQRFATETPYQFLTRLRLSRASHLLIRHQLQIQEIAESLGFANAFHFSTFFRRHSGVSPRRFREKSGIGLS